MTAGINCKGSIWRWRYIQDDVSGGATPTGTYIYRDIPTFLQENPVEQLLLQQGLETQKSFSANIYPGYYIIKEGDEFEVIAPSDHYHYGDRFRIINARPFHNRRDPRSYMALTMIRSEESHEHQ